MSLADPTVEQLLSRLVKQLSPAESEWYNPGVFTFNVTQTGLSDQQFKTLNDKLDLILAKDNQIMATLAQFQTQIDAINAGTNASATAAAAILKIINDLKNNPPSGLTAAEEDALVAKLGTAASGVAALQTFLEQTAAGGAGTPEPAPVPVPVPPTPTP